MKKYFLFAVALLAAMTFLGCKNDDDGDDDGSKTLAEGTLTNGNKYTITYEETVSNGIKSKTLGFASKNPAETEGSAFIVLCSNDSNYYFSVAKLSKLKVYTDSSFDGILYESGETRLSPLGLSVRQITNEGAYSIITVVSPVSKTSVEQLKKFLVFKGTLSNSSTGETETVEVPMDFMIYLQKYM